MKELNITNAEMAKRLNVSQAVIWERLNNTKTRDIPLSTFTTMLNALNCELYVIPTQLASALNSTSAPSDFIRKVTVKEGETNMKKWKICVGLCGPHPVWTKIITAPTAEEAVKKYLGDDYPTTPQKEIDSLTKYCVEHVPQKKSAATT